MARLMAASNVANAADVQPLAMRATGRCREGVGTCAGDERVVSSHVTRDRFVPIGGRTRHGADQELAHPVSDRLGRVEHREHVCSWNLGISPAREQRGEPVTVLGEA
jgi:hypothetical protein